MSVTGRTRGVSGHCGVRLGPALAGIVMAVLPIVSTPAQTAPATSPPSIPRMDDARYHDWLARWQTHIVADARNRYCDKENGEEIGWLLTPFLDGFYYGHVATDDPRWVDRLVDWADSWIQRGVKEPDGFLGWPKPKAAGTVVDRLDDFDADSLLGEAMALRPVVLMARRILASPTLEAKYGAKARGYLKLAEQVYEKWDRRGAWRETKDGGMITVVLPFGIDRSTGGWTDGYARRNEPGAGFSHPENKANHVARWLLALYDATGKPVYKDRAERWFRLMKSRMTIKPDGKTYPIWNYWQPAGAWDYKPGGAPKHWVGVHPNPGYYEIDVHGIVDAYEHGLVFDRRDIDRLVATALAERRYWTALAPYSPEIRQHIEATLKPDSWGGLGAVPWYLSLQPRPDRK
jgi:hypothetical protein